MSENVKEVKKRGRKKKTEENTEETENVKRNFYCRNKRS